MQLMDTFGSSLKESAAAPSSYHFLEILISRHVWKLKRTNFTTKKKKWQKKKNQNLSNDIVSAYGFDKQMMPFHIAESADTTNSFVLFLYYRGYVGIFFSKLLLSTWTKRRFRATLSICLIIHNWPACFLGDIFLFYREGSCSERLLSYYQSQWVLKS